MDVRQNKVTMETDRYRIDGSLTLPLEGYRSRLSDFVNQRDREFFSLSDVTLTELDGGKQHPKVPFMMIQRQHVRMITPHQGES